MSLINQDYCTNLFPYTLSFHQKFNKTISKYRQQGDNGIVNSPSLARPQGPGRPMVMSLINSVALTDAQDYQLQLHSLEHP